MKKILATCIVLLSVYATTGVYAAEWDETATRGTGVIQPGTIVTWTSEPCGIEQEWLEWFINNGSLGAEMVTTNPDLPADNMKRYPCVVGANNGFVDFISELYRFMYFAALIFGVIMIVLAGIIMSMSGVVGEKSKEFAKNWIPKILVGLACLVLIPFILKTVAPFFFR